MSEGSLNDVGLLVGVDGEFVDGECGCRVYKLDDLGCDCYGSSLGSVFSRYGYSKYDRFVLLMHEKVVNALNEVEDETYFARDDRLFRLFNDLTCRIDHVIQRFFSEVDSTNLPPRYFLMLSRYYLTNPSLVEQFLHKGLHLWNSSPFKSIFALLCHEWLFCSQWHSSLHNVKWIVYFIRCSNKLFWLDLENKTSRFFCIWLLLLKVMKKHECWRDLRKLKYLDVFSLVAKFYFYYAPHYMDRLRRFLLEIETLFELHEDQIEKPSHHSKISMRNMFVNEVIRGIRVMKNEEILIHYLLCIKETIGELGPLGKKTKIRLFDLLSDLSTLGYPMYPTHDVIRCAKEVFDGLWPRGSIVRGLTRLYFRFFRPLSLIEFMSNWRVILAHISGYTMMVWIVRLVLDFILVRRWNAVIGDEAKRGSYGDEEDGEGSVNRVFTRKEDEIGVGQNSILQIVSRGEFDLQAMGHGNSLLDGDIYCHSNGKIALDGRFPRPSKLHLNVACGNDKIVSKDWDNLIRTWDDEEIKVIDYETEDIATFIKSVYEG